MRTFFEKPEKTDTVTTATYLFTYLQTNNADNVTSWVEDLRQAQKCRHPHKPRDLHPYKGMSPNPCEAPPALDMHMCSFYRPTLLYA